MAMASFPVPQNCSACINTGTMQMLEVRHWQLFLHKEYTAQEWQFEPACSHSISHHCSEAGAGVFDVGHFRSKETQGINTPQIIYFHC
jgi:hypothetical protein